MPSYRDMLALPHDPLIGEALRDESLRRARAEYAEACRKLRRDPALTAFEMVDHTPVETIRFDIAADYQWMKPVVTGWRAVHGVESLIGVPVRWFKMRDGRTNTKPVCDVKRSKLLTVSWFNDIISYSTDEVRPA